MHGGVSWGGGTNWEFENVIDLCEGTQVAERTVSSFETWVRNGYAWWEETCIWASGVLQPLAVVAECEQGLQAWRIDGCLDDHE